MNTKEKTGPSFLEDASALDVIAEVLRGEHGETDRDKINTIQDLVRDTGRENV